MMTAGFMKNKNVSRLDEVVMEYGSPRSIENPSVNQTVQSTAK